MPESWLSSESLNFELILFNEDPSEESEIPRNAQPLQYLWHFSPSHLIRKHSPRQIGDVWRQAPLKKTTD